MKTKELEEKIEQLIDATTLMEVRDALVAVCHAKADHLRSNWQDEETAVMWEKVAHRFCVNCYGL